MNKQLNIALLCHTGAGGSGIVATELGLALAGIGHKVHILGSQKPFRMTEERILEISSIRSGYQKLGDQPPIKSFWGQVVSEARSSVENWLGIVKRQQEFDGNIQFHELLTFDYPLFMESHYTLRAANSLAELIRENNIEIVHAHYAIPHGTSAVLARDAGSNVKVITTVHGTDVTTVGMNSAFYHTTRHALLNSDAVTAVSQSLAASVVTDLNVHSPIDVIYNWVDCERFKRSVDPTQRLKFAHPDEALIVHASNFRPIKRSIDAIYVFSEILKELPARLLMIGDGPEREACIDLCHQLDIIGRVQFLDFTPCIERLMGVCDLLLLPSEYESFGLVALEAMASGVVVIASDVGGLSELIEHGQSGILVQQGNLLEMTAASLAILQNPDLKDQIGQRARVVAVERFSPIQAFEAYLTLYHRLLFSNEALSP